MSERPALSRRGRSCAAAPPGGDPIRYGKVCSGSGLPAATDAEPADKDSPGTFEEAADTEDTEATDGADDVDARADPAGAGAGADAEAGTAMGAEDCRPAPPDPDDAAVAVPAAGRLGSALAAPIGSCPLPAWGVV